MSLFGPPNIEKLLKKGDVKRLIRALGYEKDVKVRQAAAKALGQFSDPQVNEALAAFEDRQKGYQEDSQMASYRLTKTSLGNPLILEVQTEKYCVYCKHLSEPNLQDLDYPKGAGECSNWGLSGKKDLVSFDETCRHWKPNTKVRFWLSKGYMKHNREAWPRKPWYQVFDDGPDGEKGTH